jgi:hypothetical protein
MQRVLSRSVTAGGVTYPEGTDVEQLPATNRASVIGSGWTRYASDEEEDPEPSEPAGEPQGASPGASEPAENDEPSTTNDEPVTTDDTDATDQAEAADPLAEIQLQDLEISDELKELLHGAELDGQPLVTVLDAIRFRQANGDSFRVIKGIGKVGNAEINQAISAAV